MVSRFLSGDSIIPGAADGSGGGAATLGYDENTRLTPLTTDFHEFLAQVGDENREVLQYGPFFLWDEKVRKEHNVPRGPLNPQALNHYAYCLNNPLRYVDPTGHDGQVLKFKLKLDTTSRNQLLVLMWNRIAELNGRAAVAALAVGAAGVGTTIVGAGAGAGVISSGLVGVDLFAMAATIPLAAGGEAAQQLGDVYRELLYNTPAEGDFELTVEITYWKGDAMGVWLSIGTDRLWIPCGTQCAAAQFTDVLNALITDDDLWRDSDNRTHLGISNLTSFVTP